MKTKSKKITDLKTTLEEAFFPVKEENFGKNLIDLIDELSNDIAGPTSGKKWPPVGPAIFSSY